MNELSRKKKYFEFLKNLDIEKVESDYQVIDDRVVFKVKIALKDNKEITSHGECEIKNKNAFRLAETRAFLRVLEIIFAMKGLNINLKEDKLEEKKPSRKQINYLKHLASKLGKNFKEEEINNLNEKEIRVLIENYKKESEEKKWS